MTKFADIAKAPTDLLSDDYTSKISLKCKKNAGPLAVTIETERGNGGSLSSKIGTKFSYAGVSFDKIQFKPDGSTVLESSMSPMPGMKVAFKGLKGGNLHVDYTKGAIVSNFKFDVMNGDVATGAATAAIAPGVVVGGDATYSASAKGLKSFNVGANYATGPLFASVTTSKNVSSFNLGLLYKVSPQLTVASTTTHSAAKPVDAIVVGGLYKANVGDVKAKINSDGILSAALIKEIAPKVTLTASGSAPVSDLSSFKYGVGISM